MQFVDMACGFGGGLQRMMEHGHVLMAGPEKDAIGLHVHDLISAPAKFVDAQLEIVTKFLTVTHAMNDKWSPGDAAQAEMLPVIAKDAGMVLKLRRETGKTIILITDSVDEALLSGERLVVMAPRPGRIFKQYRLPFAERGVNADLREVKKSQGFTDTREEILSMIWGMEEEIMGRTEAAS